MKNVMVKIITGLVLLPVSAYALPAKQTYYPQQTYSGYDYNSQGFKYGSKSGRAAQNQKSNVVNPAASGVDFYLGAFGGIGMLEFKNKYSDEADFSVSESLDYNPFSVSAVAGLSSNNWRGELEIGYISPFDETNRMDEFDSVEKFKFSQYFAMLNGFYDFGDATWKARPYIGLGAGLNVANITHSMNMGDTEYGVVSIDKKTFNEMRFSANLMLGLTFALGERVYMDLGYKMLFNQDVDITENMVINDTNDVSVKTKISEDLSHWLRLGIKFKL